MRTAGRLPRAGPVRTESAGRHAGLRLRKPVAILPSTLAMPGFMPNGTKARLPRTFLLAASLQRNPILRSTDRSSKSFGDNMNKSLGVRRALAAVLMAAAAFAASAASLSKYNADPNQ